MPDPFHYPPLTPDELAAIRLPVSRDDLLSLARQIPAWRRGTSVRDDDDWIAAAGDGLDGLRTLLGWALGARGDVEIIRNATSWTLRDPDADLVRRSGRVTWTDGTSPRLRFDAERIDPTVARCPDEATFLRAAAREVARRPNL